jgi:hypothetical protein
MIPVRLELLEFNARRTAKELSDRRPILDSFLHFRADYDAAQASRQSSDGTLPPVDSPTASPRKPVSRPQSVPSSPVMRAVVRDSLGNNETRAALSSLQRPSSTPNLAQGRESRRPLRPPHQSQTMHQRAQKVLTAARQNARELADRREYLDDEFAEYKNYRMLQGSAMELDLGPDVRSRKVSHNAHRDFAQLYSLKPVASATKVRPAFRATPPLRSLLKRNRFEDVSENGALWALH